MTRIDIISGFLGAGKTTLIKKLLMDALKGQQVVLIENEFGEIGIDGGFLKDAGIEIREMNSGCICCSLVGDFGKALTEVITKYHPDRIIIEPSGVGKLSDVIKAVNDVEKEAGVALNSATTVVDVNKCKMYMRNFGEFFNDQVENADLIVMSRTDTASPEKILAATELLKGLNHHSGLITTPWDKVSGKQIAEAMDENGLKAEMERLAQEHHEHHHEHDHEHHHHEHDENCTCGCHDHEHHHEHDHEHEEHEHHHLEHDENCTCGCHDHEHHHHADEIFTSWGMETPRKFSEDELRKLLSALGDEERFGAVLRAKGIVDASDGEWIYFDYVPGESDIRRGAAAVTGRFCVIGSKLNEQALKELFNIE